jgi:hypothetical protein
MIPAVKCLFWNKTGNVYINVAFRRFGVTIFIVEKLYYILSVCL